nr:hypothetical protein Iba_chr07dCG5550 [Ipomoea batatas]
MFSGLRLLPLSLGTAAAARRMINNGAPVPHPLLLGSVGRRQQQSSTTSSPSTRTNGTEQPVPFPVSRWCKATGELSGGFPSDRLQRCGVADFRLPSDSWWRRTAVAPLPAAASSATTVSGGNELPAVRMLTAAKFSGLRLLPLSLGTAAAARRMINNGAPVPHPLLLGSVGRRQQQSSTMSSPSTRTNGTEQPVPFPISRRCKATGELSGGFPSDRLQWCGVADFRLPSE